MKKLVYFLALAFACCTNRIPAQGVPQNIQKLSGNLTASFTVPNGITIQASGSGQIIATSLSGSYVGSTSITTLGTITTGVWNGTSIPVVFGGTGGTSKVTGFNGLSPMTTSGDLIYGATSGSGTRLPIGSNGQILTVVSGLPAWTTFAASGTVGSGTTDQLAAYTGSGTTVAGTGTPQNLTALSIGGTRGSTAFRMNGTAISPIQWGPVSSFEGTVSQVTNGGNAYFYAFGAGATVNMGGFTGTTVTMMSIEGPSGLGLSTLANFYTLTLTTGTPSVTGQAYALYVTQGKVHANEINQTAGEFHTWGSTFGTSGYGFWDDAGTMKYKNSGGSWTAFSGGGGGTPGGSTTQVQYNNAGSFGGISGFTSNGTAVTATAGNLIATQPRFVTSVDDTNGNEIFKITATASAVNEVTFTNAATTAVPNMAASGGDTNILLGLNGKGTSGVLIGDLNATAAGASADRLLNVAGTNAVMLVLRTGSGAPSVEFKSRSTINSADIAYWDIYANSNAATLDDLTVRGRNGSNLDVFRFSRTLVTSFVNFRITQSAAPAFIAQNTTATNYSSVRLYNDQNSSSRALEIDYAGSTFSGSLFTSGPTGESAGIVTTGAFAFTLGTNNTARITMASGGDVTIVNTTASTTTGTGALIVAGGAGIAGQITAGGAFKTTVATASSSITTGSGIFAGGVGITGAAWIGGLVNIVGDLQLAKTITTAGTTGNQTINKTTGSVNFAAAATSLTVTNSLVTTSSVINITVATNDTTMKSAVAVAGAGSFVITSNAAATAETRVNFVVTN
jgi:hypothetical protein